MPDMTAETSADTPTGAPPEAVVADRPGAEKQTVVHTMPWYAIILVRALRAALSAFMGLNGISLIGTGSVPSEGTLLLALKVAAGAFVWSMLQNAAELLAKLDQTNPGLRA